MNTIADVTYAKVKRALRTARRQANACLELNCVFAEETSAYALAADDSPAAMRAFLTTFNATKDDRFGAWHAYEEGWRTESLLSSLLW